MAEDRVQHVRACLIRRRRMLDQSVPNLRTLALGARRDTESWLQGWVTFDEQLLSSAHTLPGSLGGIPVGVKDVIDVEGMPTRAGSLSRLEVEPARHDADVVRRLRAHGAIICGKTTTTEFAYLDPSTTTNPFSRQHTPGGSSSGSAAVVGAGVVPLALGTQTAGSVCRPAAWCGTYAFKPSTGRTSKYGVEPFAPSFDTVGVFGLNLPLVIQAALITIGEETVLPKNVEKLPSIAYLRDPYFNDLSDDCRDQLDRSLALLRAAGCSVRSAHIGLDFELLRDVHRRIMRYEAYQHHQNLLHSQPDSLGHHWRGALQMGANVTQAQAIAAMRVLTDARQRIEAEVGDADLVIGSPVRTEALAGIGSTGDAGLIIPWTYAGVPLIVVPTGLSAAGLPLAIMLAGRRGHDAEAARDALTVSRILHDGGMAIDA